MKPIELVAGNINISALFTQVLLVYAAIVLYLWLEKKGFFAWWKKMRSGGGQSNYYYEDDNDHTFHQRQQDPDFSYMSHDEPVDDREPNYLLEGYHGEELDPRNPEHLAVYDMYDDK